MQTLEVHANGLEHHVLAWGAEEAGAVALLLHGFMDAAGTWDLVAPHLAEAGLRVLAPDMRGFGRGPRVPAGAYYHFADYVADVDGLVDALVASGQRLFLVGHSMGGTVATLYAGTRPERVTKLADLEGLGPPDHPHEVAPDRMRAWLDGLRTLAPSKPMTPSEALDRLAGNHRGVDRAVLESRLPHLVRDAGGGSVTWCFDPLHRTTSPVPFFAKSFRAFAARVTAPVLFVSGGPRGYHPPDEEERLAAFPRLVRRELPESGHMMHWTAPRELASTLISFWRGETLDTVMS